jgi:hypothetical protein
MVMTPKKDILKILENMSSTDKNTTTVSTDAVETPSSSDENT